MPFLFFWLFAWTIGVLFIQRLTILDPLTPTLLFAFTHGGAEVAVMRVAATQLLTSATTPPRPPHLELDHDGLRANWARGSGSAVVAGFSAVFFGVIHLALVLGVVHTLTSASHPASWPVALGWLAAWTWTGTRTAQDLAAYQRSRGQIALDADLDGVQVDDRGVVTRLPLQGLEVAQVGDTLTLSGRDHAVSVPCKASPEAEELVATLALMSGRAVAPQAQAVPAELHRIRAGSVEG